MLFLCAFLRRIAEMCADCMFPMQKNQQILRRFVETMNLRKNCSDKYQNPGS